MSDTTPPNEANFVLAAEKAIDDLRLQASMAAAAAVTAKNAADRAEKSAKRWKKLTVLLGVIILLLGGAYFQLHQQAVTSCHAGNSFRSNQTQVWEKFIDLATAGQKEDIRSQSIIHDLLAYVHQVDAPRVCNSSVFVP